MKIILTILMCSATSNVCMPPYIAPDIYNNYYNCLLDGYKLAQDKTIEIGKKEVNEHKIYMKFDCKELILPPEKPSVDT
jgi:hypothetical protein|tara:strand:- start:33 stop:269 length:237 start_codon:yes stop_codon:yes gene_type:complete